MPTWQDYAKFLRSLDSVSERETATQLVFSAHGISFCWVSKNLTGVQLFPALGKASSPTRMLIRKGALTLCTRSSDGHVDAQYDDPNHVLKPLWSYPGFRLTDCSYGYGCGLIKQAHEQVCRQDKVHSEKMRPRKQEITEVPLPKSEPEAPTLDEIKTRVEERRDHIIRILRTFRTTTERENPSAMISRLERDGSIPSYVASMMHLMRLARNRIKYENHFPSNSEWRALQNAWNVIDEWWKQSYELKQRRDKI